MRFKYHCDADCRSPRCPAALERIAAGWRNGVTPPEGEKFDPAEWRKEWEAVLQKTYGVH